jgi:hypothetical protein
MVDEGRRLQTSAELLEGRSWRSRSSPRRHARDVQEALAPSARPVAEGSGEPDPGDTRRKRWVLTGMQGGAHRNPRAKRAQLLSALDGRRA